MKKIKYALAALILAGSLTSCGYDGHFRYPCQDPANWEKEDCKPPICTATQTCPVDLVKTDTQDGTTATLETGTPNE
jgi:predicted small lipoprotein YifL